jgi:NTP pyrophosphatase (non-canonical NTP hydrolase)
MTDETTTLAQLRQLMAAFVAEREWQTYHDPKNLSMSVAIEAAELMEHFQWVRSDELEELLDDERRQEKIADEVADIACFVLSLANALELDLSSAVERKIAKNAAKYPIEDFRGRYVKPERDT